MLGVAMLFIWGTRRREIPDGNIVTQNAKNSEFLGSKLASERQV